MAHPFESRTVLLMMLLVSLAMPLHQTQAQSPVPLAGTYERTLAFGGRERTYRVHIPGSPAPGDGFPVLIVLHGGGGNGSQMERKTGFSTLADQKGFVAVYPDGTGRFGKMLTWDAHNCCGYAYSEQVDDVGFISALIDQLIADLHADPARIYITGHSNGAMMTFRLACELSDKIAAAAPYAGALNTDSCPATQPVPMLIMNGDADQNVPVAGGTSENRRVVSQRTRVDRPTSYAVDTWVGIDGCASTPIVTESAGVTISTYQNCANGATVEQELIHGWSHKWPTLENGAPIDGAETIWAFVSQFSKSTP